MTEILGTIAVLALLFFLAPYATRYTAWVKAKEQKMLEDMRKNERPF